MARLLEHVGRQFDHGRQVSVIRTEHRMRSMVGFADNLLVQHENVVVARELSR